MPLVTCPDCAREISDQAPACVHCGCPMQPPAVPPTPAHDVGPMPRSPSSTGPAVDEQRGARTLGTIGVVCGVLGLLVFPYLLGGVAIVCGIASAMKGEKRGVAAIVLGVLSFALSMLVTAVFSSP